MPPNSRNWPVKPYQPRNTQYSPDDFKRQDESSDSSFYSVPRFVTHIDEAAIRDLREYYDSVLPHKGRILDFCSSWISHYPKSVEDASQSGDLKVIGLGMNKAELDANNVLSGGRLLVDLNKNPDISDALRNENLVTADEDSQLDASTNVVSIDYLVSPTEVLKSLRQITKKGGAVHLTISNRCFPTKAMSRWLRVSEDERLMMVGDFLHTAGWHNIEIVTLSDGKLGEDEQAPPPQGLQGLMAWMGMNSRDPLWVVRATNE
jgi:hypothetical protein